MSIEQNKATVRRIVDEIVDQGNKSVIPDLIAPDCVFRAATKDIIGTDGFAEMIGNLRTAAPDYHASIEDMVGEGDRVFAQIAQSGTLGASAGVGPVPRHMQRTVVNAYRLSGGKCVEVVPGFVSSLATEKNKAVVRRYYDEILNKGDYEIWDQLMAEGYVLRTSQAATALKGKEGGKENYEQRKAMAADSIFTIEEMFAEGDSVIVRGDVKGTNTGEIYGNPPTGKKFSRAYVGIYHLKDGKIAEGWTVQDVLGFFRQLGISPPAQ